MIKGSMTLSLEFRCGVSRSRPRTIARPRARKRHWTTLKRKSGFRIEWADGGIRLIKLFEHPLSPYAQKVKIVLLEKGLPFEATTPIGAQGVDPVFAKASPRGEVPMLVDGSAAIFDSTIICEYIDDKYPAKPMRPASAEERARVRMLEDTLDTIYEGVTWAVFEIEGWGRATGELKTTLLKRAGEQIAQFNGWLERELGSRTWFNGEAFGWGDACAYPFVAGAAGQGNVPRAGTKLAGWLARVMERTSVKRCIADI